METRLTSPKFKITGLQFEDDAEVCDLKSEDIPGATVKDFNLKQIQVWLKLNAGE